MKRIIVFASAIAVLAGVLSLARDAYSEPGKEPAAAASTPHKVGLIDMAHIFKNYKKFERLREDLKARIAKSEDEAKALQAEIVELQGRIKTYSEGSADFTKTEQMIVQKAADFETFKRQMGREFLKEEAKIYQQVYNEVLEAVKFFAERRDYTLVMRFNKEDPEADNANPQAILASMNRQVVYHRDDDDITGKILQMLNDRDGRREGGGAKTPRDDKPPKSADENPPKPRTSDTTKKTRNQ